MIGFQAFKLFKAFKNVWNVWNYLNELNLAKAQAYFRQRRISLRLRLTTEEARSLIYRLARLCLGA
jgi:hypothetical protein